MVTVANVWGQTTIASDGLNNSTSAFNLTGGAYYSGSSATGDRVANSPFFSEGTHGYGVTNGTATLLSNNINTSGYSSVSATFKLASFSIGSTSNGADANDIVTVEISPDGGTNWYSTARVLGNANAYWSYSAGGLASTAYDGNATPVDFSSASGNAGSGGFSTVSVTGLPAVTNLRVRITLLNNAAAERWIVDDFKVTGTSAPTSAPVVTSGTGFTGTVNTLLSNFQISASNSPSSYAINSGTLPAGLNFNTTTGIISGTPTVAGAGSVTVTATNAIGTSSPVPVTYNIAKAGQTITFAVLAARSYGDANFTLSATSNSGLAVSYASSNPAVATVSGNTVTIVGVGNTNIIASQAGDATYNPATDVSRSLVVNTRSLTVTGLTAANKVYNASNIALVDGSPVLNNVLDGDVGSVTLSGTPTFTFANANIGANKTITTSGLSLTGSKASNYSLTPPSLVASITPKPLTVTNAVAYDKTFDGTTIATVTGGTLNGVEPADAATVLLAPNGVFATSDAGTNIAVTLNLTGNTLNNYTLTQPGLTANILKAVQAIIFDDIPVVVLPSSLIDLNEYAYSTQGLELTYASSNPAVASVTDNILTPLAAGTVTITASQAGGTNYDPATSVEKVVTIIATPVATPADPITYTSITANWLAVPGAERYALDVYKKETGVGEVAETASWNFNTASPALVPNEISISAISQGNNNGTTTLIDGGSASSGYVGASGGNNAGAAARIGALNTATGGSAYFQFTVTPNNGSFTLTGISFGTRSTGTGPQLYTLRSSADGYTTDIATGTISGTSWSLKTNSSLSVVANQAVIFRLYGYNGSGGAQASTANWRIDDLSLNVIVPTTTEVKSYVLENENVDNVTSYTVANLEQNTEYFYVVRAVNGSAVTADSNEIDVTTKTGIVWNGTAWSNGDGPTGTEDAEIIGAYNINEGFEVNNLTIVGDGLLAIQNNQDVVVNGTISVFTDNRLVLENDANLIQTSAGVDNNPSINHAILVKRFALLPTVGYTFWSSPVSDQNLYSFSDGYNSANGGTGDGTPWNRFFVYNEANDYFVTNIAGEITLNNQSIFDTGRGYAIKGKNTFGNILPYPTTTFSFSGKINNGQLFSQNLKNSCAQEAGCEKGYNLVGNPYPSSIDFEALYNANSSKIYGSAYFWTNNDITALTQQGSGYSGNNYAIYNLSGGTPAVEVDPNPGNAIEVPNGVVKLGQGFIVKAKVAGVGQPLEFNNDIRLGYDPGAIFYNSRTAVVKDRFWLTFTSPTNISNTILMAYLPQATNDFEINYDGELFVIGSDSFYSILGARKLAIQGKADFNADDKVALGNVYSKAGEYKISIKNKEGIFTNGQNIYLKDKQLNKIVNLSEQDYVFQATKGTNNTRFEIVYKDSSFLGADDIIKKSDFNIYKDGNAYVVASTKPLGRVDVYDVSGKLLKSIKTNDSTLRIDVLDLPNGVYIIKAENSGDIHTKKIIK
ncbi:YDG domain-containing protein [Chryseobacterium sp. FH1]|uniref:YDG domain-containing protein n=1 Tax=Chryseobacterium sp. FH1 TaxID=1233951 RepID=UPI0004E29914|nr:YDG domain-containing protein [Chryseobacterium sp. FH1]KFC19994.1 hypothetical protein IO90_12315 [Chryseobacterium sp. FH1]